MHCGEPSLSIIRDWVLGKLMGCENDFVLFDHQEERCLIKKFSSSIFAACKSICPPPLPTPVENINETIGTQTMNEFQSGTQQQIIPDMRWIYW